MMTFLQYVEAQGDVLQKMSNYLQQLGVGCQLIAHQTFSDSAARILSDGLGRNGLHGTALFVQPQEIIGTASTMFGQAGGAAIHRGANALVVLAVPRQIMQQYNIRSMQGLDEHLSDVNAQGKIPTIGLPRAYVVGYFANGQFIGNGRFSPRVEGLTL